MSKHPQSNRSASPEKRSAGNSTSSRKGLLILGMHRSGTSALARVLSLMGATLPTHLMETTEGNETGHWEPEKLVALHDALLAQAGSRWDDYRPLDLGPDSLFNEAGTVAKIKAQIVEDYGSSDLFLIKDPRISRFVPVYARVLFEMDARPVVVLAIRNPLAVVRSLMARKSVPVYSARYASLLWLRHCLDAERSTRGMPRYIISYENLLEDWRRAVSRIEEELRLGLPVGNPYIAGQIDDFLRQDLQHQKTTGAEFEASDEISPLVRMAYAALLRLESESLDGDAQKALDDIAAQFGAADSAVGEAVHEEFSQRQRHLEAVLVTARHESHGHYVRGLQLQAKNEHLEKRTSELAIAQADMEKRAMEYSAQLLDAREMALGLLEQIAQRNRDIEQLRSQLHLAEGKMSESTKMLADLTDRLSATQLAAASSAARLAESELAVAALTNELAGARDAATTSAMRLVEIEQVLASTIGERDSARDVVKSTTEDVVALRLAQAVQTAERAPLAQACLVAETNFGRIVGHLAALRGGDTTLPAGEPPSLETAMAMIDTLEADFQALREQATALAAERTRSQALSLQASVLRWQVEAMKQSTSWRLTAPLRSMALAFPRLTRATKRATRVIGYVRKGQFTEKLGAWRSARRMARLSAQSLHREDRGTPAVCAAVHASETIEFGESPLVSIIILNYNKPDLTVRSVQHVIDNTASISHEIIVVDNGSELDRFAKLVETLQPAARLIRIEVNRYFGEGNNIGAEVALGRYVVFLNNDAFVTENWLAPMLEVFDTCPQVGGVGPKFIYPDGRLQEVGGMVHADGSVIQIGKAGVPDPAILTDVREVDYSSAACFLMARDRFIEMGGFDLVYEPAYYEDVDLCLKLRAGGLKVYCVPLSTVIHIENATSSDDSIKAMQLNTIVEHNRKKFLSRWGAWFETPGLPVWKAQPRQVIAQDGRHGRSAAIYTPYNLVPGGGERYLLHTAQVLSCQYDVTIVTEHPYSSIRIREMLRDFAIAPFPFDMAVRRTLNQPFDLAVVLGNEALPAFAGFGQRNIYICQFPFPISEPVIHERRHNLENYEAVVVYSDFVRNCLIREVATIGELCPPVEVICPAVTGLSIAGKTLPASGPIRLISIGRFFVGGHNKRQDAIIEATIQLVKRGFDIELSLVGSVHPEAEHRQRYRELVAMAGGYPIAFYPDAAPETVSELLAASHIYCHAAGLDADGETHRCEHFGISVVEGMRAASVPFVVANGGPASIVTDGATGFHYRSVAELVEGIASLVANPPLFEQVSAAAHRAALTFDEASFAGKWSLAADRPALRNTAS